MPLRYKIELGIDNLEDGTPGKFSTTERLQAVYERRRLWRAINDWEYKRVVAMRGLGTSVFEETHFAWLDADSKLHILQIPSKTRRVPEKLTTVSLVGVDVALVRSLSMNVDLDLVVVLIGSAE